MRVSLNSDACTNLQIVFTYWILYRPTCWSSIRHFKRV